MSPSATVKLAVDGTFFLLYDFIDYFQRDGSSPLEREKFIEILNTIFKGFSTLERDAIIFQYTDWENLSDKYLNQRVLGDLVGDYFFVCPTNFFANVFAEQGGKVYYYYFTQRTSAHPWGDWMGVIHGDEIAYVFGQPLNLSMTSYNARERDLSMRIMQSFSKFSVTGDPGPEDSEWPRYTKDSPVYYIYDAVNVGLGKGPRAEACEFWNGLMPEIKDFVDTNIKNCGVQENLKTDFNATRSNSVHNIVDVLVLLVALYAPLLILGFF